MDHAKKDHQEELEREKAAAEQEKSKRDEKEVELMAQIQKLVAEAELSRTTAEQLESKRALLEESMTKSRDEVAALTKQLEEKESQHKAELADQIELTMTLEERVRQLNLKSEAEAKAPTTDSSEDDNAEQPQKVDLKIGSISNLGGSFVLLGD